MESNGWFEDLYLNKLNEDIEVRIGSYPLLWRYIVDNFGGVIPRVGGPFARLDRSYLRDQATYSGGGFGPEVWRGSTQDYTKSSYI